MNTQIKNITDEIKSEAETLLAAIVRSAENNELQQHALAIFGKAIELQKEIDFIEQRGSSPTPYEISSQASNNTDNDTIADEINKVNRKLPKWAVNQHQINSKILTTYLKLRRDGHTHITERAFAEAYGDQSEFIRSYPQMKSMSPKNNGKVFDLVNGYVEIWEPVGLAVAQYEATVFSED